MYGETQIKIHAWGTLWLCTAFIFGNRNVEHLAGFRGEYVGMIIWNWFNGPLFIWDTVKGFPKWTFLQKGIENPPPELLAVWEYLLYHPEAINGTEKVFTFNGKQLEIVT